MAKGVPEAFGLRTASAINMVGSVYMNLYIKYFTDI
jgi:hypothetical protein